MAIHPIEFRYGTPEMKRIWEQENKQQRMLDIESALAQAEGELGIIPKEYADEIKAKANTKFVKLERMKVSDMRIAWESNGLMEITTMRDGWTR